MLLRLLRRALSRKAPIASAEAQAALDELRSAGDDPDRLDAAIAAAERIVTRSPDLAEVRFELAGGLQRRKKTSEALAHYRRLLETHPDQPLVHEQLANCLVRLGRAAEAVPHYRRLAALQPDAPFVESSVLGSLNYDPLIGPDAIFEAHRAWGRRAALASGAALERAATREVREKLRIGYVSPDLVRHPVTYLFAPVLAQHDRTHFEIVCYDNLGRPDTVTERLKQLSHAWRDVSGDTDEEFCKRVQGDRIDILVDLAGHTTRGRIAAFARKPAPVQVSWLGYFNTTGLDAMDYFVSDPHSSPPGQERYFVERLLRLPDTRFCYEPPASAPAIAPLPAVSVGCITFGCFNNLSKINDRVIALWSRALRGVPGSRLRLISIGLHDAENALHVRERFVAQGVDATRLELQAFLAHGKLLEAYAGIDIALDPFPFSGGVTSLESLWMGVPVVTLEQPTVAGRQTLTMLRNIGLDSLVARDEQDYVEAAAALAGNLAALGELRAGLRGRMAHSPLTDAVAFTRNLEDAYRRMWRGDA